MLSKSQYIRGLQCQKSLWLYKFKPQLQNQMQDDERFQTGTDVGKLAQKLFDGGVEIEFNPSDFGSMTKKTNELLQNDTKIIYEATFIKNGIFAMADILVKKDDGYEIYEVKSSTSVKDYYIDDLSVQWYCISSILPLTKACIVHINNAYEKIGKLNLQELFCVADITEAVIQKQPFVSENLANLENMLKNEEPQILFGTQCFEPYECNFSEYCFKDCVTPSILNLYRFNKKQAYKLYHDGVITYDDISNSDLKLTATQKLQISVKNEPHIDKAVIRNFISQVKYPVNFFDFETFMDAIPRFDHQCPYMQIPFQYSLHILHENGILEHKEFLGNGIDDPRENLVKQMLNDITNKGSIIAYNMSFEKARIKELSRLFAEFENELNLINERFLDLIVPFRELGYYDENFHGSFSIKSVLPALFPNDKNLSYKELEIQNGGTASSEYANIINLKDSSQSQKIRENLLKYCKLDTLAMVEIFKKLKELC